MRTPAPLLLVVVLLATACTPEGDAEPTTTSSTTTTIGVTITSAGPAAVTVGEGVDSGAAERLQTTLDELRGITENNRGLVFLEPPRVAIVDEAEFTARRQASIDAGLDTEGLAFDTRLYQTLGLLGDGVGLEATVRRAIEQSVPAFHDPGKGELVVAATGEPLGPRHRSIVVRELVRVVTDQYHRHHDRVGELTGEGLHDEAGALAALADADATYFQLVYLDGLTDTDQVEAAEARPAPPTGLPTAVVAELAFPYESGIPFIETLIADGGIAALDTAYGADPLTTEHLRHPERYLADEGVREVPPVEVSVPGYDEVISGTFGETGLAVLLAEALPPGLRTQTTDGWGGDAHAALTDGSDVALVYTYRGDTVDDALEVAEGFLAHAPVMDLGDPIEAGGGVEHAGRAGSPDPEGEGPYLFVDREGEGLVVVIADDPAVGRQLAGAVPVP